MSMHAVKAGSYVSPDKFLDDRATRMVRNEVFHVVPVPVDGDDLVLGVVLSIVLSYLREAIFYFRQFGNVIFDRFSVLLLLRMLKLVMVRVVE